MERSLIKLAILLDILKGDTGDIIFVDGIMVHQACKTQLVLVIISGRVQSIIDYV